MSLMASLVTTSRMQQCFNVLIDVYHEFLLLFYCCVLLEIKLTSTTTKCKVNSSLKAQTIAGLCEDVMINHRTHFDEHQQMLHDTVKAKYKEWSLKLEAFIIIHSSFVRFAMSLMYYVRTYLRERRHRELWVTTYTVNTLRPRQNGRHVPDDIFKWIFLNENAWISINIAIYYWFI